MYRAEVLWFTRIKIPLLGLSGWLGSFHQRLSSSGPLEHCRCAFSFNSWKKSGVLRTTLKIQLHSKIKSKFLCCFSSPFSVSLRNVHNSPKMLGNFFRGIDHKCFVYMGQRFCFGPIAAPTTDLHRRMFSEIIRFWDANIPWDQLCELLHGSRVWILSFSGWVFAWITLGALYVVSSHWFILKEENEQHLGCIRNKVKCSQKPVLLGDGSRSLAWISCTNQSLLSPRKTSHSVTGKACETGKQHFEPSKVIWRWARGERTGNHHCFLRKPNLWDEYGRNQLHLENFNAAKQRNQTTDEETKCESSIRDHKEKMWSPKVSKIWRQFHDITPTKGNNSETMTRFCTHADSSSQIGLDPWDSVMRFCASVLFQNQTTDPKWREIWFLMLLWIHLLQRCQTALWSAYKWTLSRPKTFSSQEH